MRNLVIAAALLTLAGCTLFDSAGGLFKKSGAKAEKQASARDNAQSMQSKVRVSRPKSADPKNVTVWTGPSGVGAEIPPEADVTIESASQENTAESASGSLDEFMASASERKAGLPWGVYVAVIALIAGGVFVSFRFGLSWGVPMILSGVLVLAVLTTFTRYPSECGIALAIVCAGVAIWYGYHASGVTATAEDAAAKADAIATLKRAVEATTDEAKAEVKAAIKKIAGDKSNPVRKTLDAEIEKA